ncbi:MAG TPA: hypothetical protein VL550_02610 [Rhodocyclaceae bacterium]|jgi:hypothetical protein|nr:hypothetical protein [Rhodocyclaceae bacterium]
MRKRDGQQGDGGCGVDDDVHRHWGCIDQMIIAWRKFESMAAKGKTS